MNKSRARAIAEGITYKQLQELKSNARNGVKDWKATSKVNKGMTKGAIWNILFSDDSPNTIVKTSIIREFGEFLPESLQEKLPKKINKLFPFHQDPIFE